MDIGNQSAEPLNGSYGVHRDLSGHQPSEALVTALILALGSLVCSRILERPYAWQTPLPCQEILRRAQE